MTVYAACVCVHTAAVPYSVLATVRSVCVRVLFFLPEVSVRR